MYDAGDKLLYGIKSMHVDSSMKNIKFMFVGQSLNRKGGFRGKGAITTHDVIIL